MSSAPLALGASIACNEAALRCSGVTVRRQHIETASYGALISENFCIRSPLPKERLLTLANPM